MTAILRPRRPAPVFKDLQIFPSTIWIMIPYSCMYIDVPFDACSCPVTGTQFLHSAVALRKHASIHQAGQAAVPKEHVECLKTQSHHCAPAIRVPGPDFFVGWRIGGLVATVRGWQPAEKMARRAVRVLCRCRYQAGEWQSGKCHSGTVAQWQFFRLMLLGGSDRLIQAYSYFPMQYRRSGL